MSRIYTSGDFSVAAPISLPTFTAPFEGDNTDYILRQDFMVDALFYLPEALNTPHPDYPDFVLVNEPEKQDATGGIFRWTRTYARTPVQRNEFSTFAYTFIGFVTGGFDTQGQFTVVGRLPFAEVIRCKIVFDYFLVPDDAAAPDVIPINPAQKYYRGPDTSNITTELNDAGVVFLLGTTPSRTQYNQMIAAGTYTLVVEDSSIERWLGNIWVRTTKYIKAK